MTVLHEQRDDLAQRGAEVVELLQGLERATAAAGEAYRGLQDAACAELRAAIPGLPDERYLEMAMRSDRFGLLSALAALRRIEDGLGLL